MRQECRGQAVCVRRERRAKMNNRDPASFKTHRRKATENTATRGPRPTRDGLRVSKLHEFAQARPLLQAPELAKSEAHSSHNQFCKHTAKIGTPTDTNTDSPTDRQADRQTDRQTSGRTEKCLSKTTFDFFRAKKLGNARFWHRKTMCQHFFFLFFFR